MLFSHKSPNQTVVLLILDGWGEAPNWGGNAIAAARLPTFNEFYKTAIHTTLLASGAAVGLPGHERGNSEVGHLTIGAGRTIIQDRTRIDEAIETGTFFRNSVLIEAMTRTKKFNSTLHLVGLVSSGGVHSHINHLRALLELAHKLQVKKVAIHAITDGRDTPPQIAAQELDRVRHWCVELGVGQITSIIGRYFAMDRDNHWDRIEKAYQLITKGVGTKSNNVLSAISQSYTQGLNDETIEPIWIEKKLSPINSNDSVVMFNFRQDRSRQLLAALTDSNFNQFKRSKQINLFTATMIPYWLDKEDENVQVVFPPEQGKPTLGDTIANVGLKQIRIAETEKYAHVTYFLNGGKEARFKGEDRILIQSKLTESAAKNPFMKTLSIAHEVIKAIKSGKYSLIVANIANPDMVGHTGDFWATVNACEIVDQAVSQIKKAVDNNKAILIVTADHGNAEQLVNPITGENDPEHTTNPVPFILYDSTHLLEYTSHAQQTIADIAPTILSILNLQIPKTMTGKSLCKI